MVIGVSGGSGSGKTCFVRDLASKFAKEDVCFIHQDNYYKPYKKQFIDENNVANFDLPTALYLGKFSKDLKKLSEGETLTLKEYTFNNDKATAKDIIIKPAPVIIAEGLFLYHKKSIHKQIDFSLIVHADDSNRIIRRIKRDRIERNYPLDDVIYRYEHHVMPSYKEYIEPYLSEVDMVVNNNRSYAKCLDALGAYIQQYLDSLS